MSTIKKLRKARKFCWSAQIVLGDVIAVSNGTYINRCVRKKMHKASGKQIAKFRKKVPMATRNK